MRRRSARENPASAGGIFLTLVGFGLMAFSGFELATGGKAYKARPAPPKIKTRPAAPKATAALGPAPAAPAASSTAPAAAAASGSGGGIKPPTQAQVQQAVQTGQSIVTGAENLFGGGTPSVDASASSDSDSTSSEPTS